MRYLFFFILLSFTSCYSPPTAILRQPALYGKKLPAVFENQFAMVSDIAKYGTTLQVIIDREDSIILGRAILTDKHDTTEFRAFLTGVVSYDSSYVSDFPDINDSNTTDLINVTVYTGWGRIYYSLQSSAPGFIYSAQLWRTK